MCTYFSVKTRLGFRCPDIFSYRPRLPGRHVERIWNWMMQEQWTRPNGLSLLPCAAWRDAFLRPVLTGNRGSDHQDALHLSNLTCSESFAAKGRLFQVLGRQWLLD